jgi:hypothetical protein
MGGSTPVDPSIRLSVWLETVPALMRILNTRHVSLAAHSCGVIYAFHTLYTMPWILPPSNRKLYLFSPWVHPDQSGMTLLSLSSYLPSTLINNFDNIVRFMNMKVIPVVQLSGMISGVVSAPFSSASKNGASERDKQVEKHEQEETCLEYLGISAAENKARSKAVLNSVFNESTSGASHEALLCLKKEVAESWGICDDYESFPFALEAKFQEFFQQRTGEDASPARASFAMADGRDRIPTLAQNRFGIKVSWAEKDFMIRRQGEQYFEKCFQQFSTAQNLGTSEDDRCLFYESEIVPDTDHDTICLPQYGALSRVLEDVLNPMV